MPWDAIIWHDFWLLIGEMNTITEVLHFQGNVFFFFFWNVSSLLLPGSLEMQTTYTVFEIMLIHASFTVVI